jgi:chaperonin GroEL
MDKKVIFGEEARYALLRGVDAVARTVGTTLGPMGRNVSMDRGFSPNAPPSISHDGAKVAERIKLSDPFEDMGAQLIKAAAAKTNDAAGDGTTTSVVLAQTIVHEALKNVAAGSNAMLIRTGIDKATRAIRDALGEMSIKVETRDQIAHVASISSHSREVGELIGEAFDHIGPWGKIVYEDSPRMGFELDYVDGMPFERGYFSPYFITNKDTREAVVEDPYILITDHHLKTAQDVLPLLARLKQIGARNLVIISVLCEGEALAILVTNKQRGTFNILGVKAPMFGQFQHGALQDIAARTGGYALLGDLGRRMDTVTIGDLGRADRVVATKDDTVIFGGAGLEWEVEEQADLIKLAMAEAPNAYEWEKLDQRLSRLTASLATIRVGMPTEVQLKEMKARLRDSVEATRGAVEEGIVPGGGVSLVNTIPALDDVEVKWPDEQIGVNIVRRALEEPFRRLVWNAGGDPSTILFEVRHRQKAMGNPNIGYDIIHQRYGDMMEMGIVDTAKTMRTAMQNGASVASMIITTDALVLTDHMEDWERDYEKEQEEKKATEGTQTSSR